jgi:hypothetical protein
MLPTSWNTAGETLLRGSTGAGGDFVSPAPTKAIRAAGIVAMIEEADACIHI